MKVSSAVCLAAIVLAASMPAGAWPLNGYNEVVNGNFETGDFTGWQHGSDVIVTTDGPGQGYAATCKCPGGDLWLRQVVDNSLSPEWRWDLHSKLVDIVASIAWQGWEPSESSVSFRLDWWAESYNTLDNPEMLPYYLGPPPPGPDPGVGYFTSEWVEYSLAGLSPSQWVTLNPFNQVQLPMQPRWVSVEVSFIQAPGESVWFDDFILTGRCVPEPSSLVAVFGCFGALLAGMRLRRN